MRTKYWDDFSVGDKFITQAVTITETHVVNWGCLTGDWYPLHFDKEYAEKSPFKERIAHGPLIFGMSVGLVGMSGIFEDSLVAWLGCDKLRLPAPVKILDTIHVETEIVSKRETKNAEKGITIFKYVVKNQRDEMVMEFEYSLMMYRRIADKHFKK